MKNFINFVMGLSIIVILVGLLIGTWFLPDAPIIVKIIVSAALVFISCLVAKVSLDD